jgi:RNA methyltransferase, TrmH family
MVSKNRIKYFQSLKQKKYRQKYGHFLVEGEKSVSELLHSNFIVDEILAVPEWIAGNSETLKSIQVSECTESDLKKISSFSTPSPVCALAKTMHSAELPDQSNWVLVLDGIKDPGNMGTIIRTADWYGVNKVLCSEDCVDFYNPKVISSSMGSFTRIQAIYTNIVDYLSTSQRAMACVLEGESIYGIEPTQGGVIIIGSESHGISQAVLSLSQVKKITIPGKSEVESLNAAIATGIVLDRLVNSVEHK